MNYKALPTARELGEQLYRLAQRAATPTHLLEAHEALGTTLFYLGEFAAAQTHLEQGIARIDPAALTLWCLGFPAQAERRSQEALAQAQTLAHPYSVAVAQFCATSLQHHRRAAPAVQAQADALLSLALAQGFPVLVGYGTCWRGWALAMQGQGEAGLRLLAEALAACKESGRGDVLAEAYRLQGELLLGAGGRGAGVGSQHAVEAEACLHQALDIARRQQAKSWELRAALSLARLWQGQRQRAAARQVLAESYSWFTEGFDTADLAEARALLQELG